MRCAAPPARQGTRVEVRDLFGATPARLKFLKSARAEAQAVAEIVRRLALAHPHVAFTLAGDGIATLDLPAAATRARRNADVLGRDFEANAIPVDAMREDHALTGYVSLPTWHRGSAAFQYVFVNGRGVRDKLFAGALRGAYADYVPAGRYGAAVLFLVVRSARRRRERSSGEDGSALPRSRSRTRSRRRRGARSDRRRRPSHEHVTRRRPAPWLRARTGSQLDGTGAHRRPRRRRLRNGTRNDRLFRQCAGRLRHRRRLPPRMSDGAIASPTADTDAPLGAARTQLHETYIVAQTRERHRHRRPARRA